MLGSYSIGSSAIGGRVVPSSSSYNGDIVLSATLAHNPLCAHITQNGLTFSTTVSLTVSNFLNLITPLTLSVTQGLSSVVAANGQNEMTFPITSGLGQVPKVITTPTMSLSSINSLDLSGFINMQNGVSLSGLFALTSSPNLSMSTLADFTITHGFGLFGLVNSQNTIAFTTTSGLLVIVNINLNSDLTLNKSSAFDSIGTTSIPTSLTLPANMLMANESMLSVFPQLTLIHTSDLTPLSSLITSSDTTLSSLLSLDSVVELSISDGIFLDKVLGLTEVGSLSYSDSVLLDSFIRFSKIGGTGIFPNDMTFAISNGIDQSMLFSTLGTMDLASTFGIDQSMLLSLTGDVTLNHSHFMIQRSILNAINNQQFDFSTDLTINGVRITGADLSFAITGSLDQSHLYIANAGLILPVDMTQDEQSTAELNGDFTLQTNIVFSQLASNLIVPVGIVLTNSQGLVVSPLFSPLGVIEFDSSIGLDPTNTNTMNDGLNLSLLNVFQTLGNIDISESTELDNTLNLSIGGERTLSLSTSFPVSISTDFDQNLKISGILTLNSSNSFDFLSILSTLDQTNLYFHQEIDTLPSRSIDKSLNLQFSTDLLTLSTLIGLTNLLFSSSQSISADSTHNMGASMVLPLTKDLSTLSELAIELGLGYQFFASLGAQVSASVPTSVLLAVVSGFADSATLTATAIASLVMSGSFTAKQFESFNTYEEALSFASAVSLTHQAILNGNATLVILTNQAMSLIDENFRVDKNFNVLILQRDISDFVIFQDFQSEIKWTASDLKIL